MKSFTRVTLKIIILIASSQEIFGQVFTTDSSFQSLLFKRNDGLINSIIVQPDNKILIMGVISFVNNVSTTSPIRLNADGSIDNTFHMPNEGFSIILRPDGKILGKSTYSNSNGENFAKIDLFKSNGELDSTFQTNIKSNSVSYKAFALTSNNQIIIGELSSENGLNKGTINRINTNGTIDNTFNTGSLKISSLAYIVIQSDGKILVSGLFEFINGSSQNIIRLNKDGSLDTSFNPPSIYNLFAIALQKDGKILIGGNDKVMRLNIDGSEDNSFHGVLSRVNSIAVQPDGKIVTTKWTDDKNNYFLGYNKVIRLNTDGTEDASFVSDEQEANLPIYALAIESTGKILVGGYFTKYNGYFKYNLIRLKGTDGSLDPALNVKLETTGGIEEILLQSDNKLLVAGGFDAINNQPTSCLIRLNVDGTTDNTFNVGTGLDGFLGLNKGDVRAISLQNNKKILVGGYFTSFNGKPANSLLRLNEDGSRDETFTYTETADHSIATIAVQADGNIIIGCAFSPFISSNALKRLRPDGSVDQSFNIGTGFNNAVTNAIIQPNDQKILVTGYFTSYNNTPVQNIVRLNPDGTIDNTFVAVKSPDPFNKIILQPDGKLLLKSNSVGKIIRLNPNGTLDETFNSGLSTSDQLNYISLQTNGSILLTGSFSEKHLVLLNTDGSMNKDFSVIEQSQNFYYKVIQVGTKILVNSLYKLVMLNPPVMIDQTITFNSIPDKFSNSPAFTLNATASSGLPVSYKVIAGPATISGNTVTLNGTAGQVTIRASQDGNLTYTKAPDVEIIFQVNLILGIENNMQEVRFYPNPASDFFRIELPPNLKKTSIQLLDAQGNLTNTKFKNISSGYEIDTQSLPRGLYVIRLLNEDWEISRKVILK